MKGTIENTLKNEYLTEQKFIQNKLYQSSKMITKYYEKEKEKRLKKLEEEKRKILEKYDQISQPYNKYIDQVILQSMNLDQNEIQQLETWTNKKCSEVIFDSNKDNWNKNTSVFSSRMINKSHVIIIVEDTNKNKFGYYLSTLIVLGSVVGK